LTGPDKKTSWLFKNNQHAIVAAEQIRRDQSAAEQPTRAIFVHYIAADSNGDGVVSEDDDGAVGVARADGSAFVPVAQGVRGVISREMGDDNHVSIVYQRGTSLRHAKFSLASFTLSSDTEILKAPDN
jgi:hypothetical protein